MSDKMGGGWNVGGGGGDGQHGRWLFVARVVIMVVMGDRMYSFLIMRVETVKTSMMWGVILLLSQMYAALWDEYCGMRPCNFQALRDCSGVCVGCCFFSGLVMFHANKKTNTIFETRIPKKIIMEREYIRRKFDKYDYARNDAESECL